MQHRENTASPKGNRRRLVVALLLGATFGPLRLGAANSLAAGAQSPLVVVVRKGESIDNLSLKELSRIFTTSGERVQGQAWIPFNHPPRTVDRAYFDEKVLGMTPEQVVKFWIDRKIRGSKPPPRTVDSKSMLLRALAGMPGAIGYVRANDLTPDVKAIRVDGKRPTDADYPLR